MNNLSDGIALSGRYRIRHAETGEILAESRNLVTAAGLELVAAYALSGGAATDGLQYFALGTGTTTPDAEDTQLVSESVRGIPTATQNSGVEILFSRFFPAADVTFHIREAGVFSGSGATGTPNSGTLFSRALLNYDNTTTAYDLVFDYTLTVSRG